MKSFCLTTWIYSNVFSVIGAAQYSFANLQSSKDLQRSVIEGVTKYRMTLLE